jgi:hypothetical protein
MPVRGTLEELFIILNKGQGTCLDVQDGSTDDGAHVVHNSWWGGNNQRWELIPVGEGYFRIYAKHSGLCLTIENDTLIQQSYNGTDSQKWRIKGPKDEIYYEIENKGSLKCLTINESDTKVIQDHWLGSLDGSQEWRLIPAEQSWMNNIAVTYGPYSSPGEGWKRVGDDLKGYYDLNLYAGGETIYLWVRGPNTDNIAVVYHTAPPPEGWKKLDYDLNAGCGAGSAYIYLWVRGPATGNIAVTYGPYPAGEGWTKVGGEGYKGGDLNAGCGAGSAYIYLWIR